MSPLVLGIDSSTQSTKALLVDADSGEVVDQRRAAHPDGTEVDPQAWIRALEEAAGPLLERAQAVAVGGQQHGMVALDDQDRPVRDALLWNDTRSAPQAEELIRELGGPAEAARRTGSVHVASITSAKLRWLRDHEPQNARRVARVALPHDWISHHLDAAGGWFTDRGDASGTGWFSPQADDWDPQLLVDALGHEASSSALPEAPQQAMGRTASGALIAPGTGDNMAAALGLSMGLEDVSLSIGTSGVAAAVNDVPVADPSGSINGFADATGRWLPLACTLNAARVLDYGAQLLGVDHDGLSELALASEPGARGAVLVPYLDGERTPNRPEATGSLTGLTRRVRREDLARAVVEGLLCSLTDAVEMLEQATGRRAERILLIGGGARSQAVRQLAAGVIGREILAPEPQEYVALGAARQAAWCLSGAEQPPQWEPVRSEPLRGEHHPEIMERYRAARG